MKKLNKKGFTIVELSIVIAVVAILSAVMIPTFSGIVKKAKKSAAAQEADTALTAVITEEEAQLNEAATYYFISGDYWFKYENGKLVDQTAITDATADANDIIYTVDGALADNAPVAIATAGDPATPVITVSTLEDLGSVIVWVSVPNV